MTQCPRSESAQELIISHCLPLLCSFSLHLIPIFSLFLFLSCFRSNFFRPVLPGCCTRKNLTCTNVESFCRNLIFLNVMYINDRIRDSWNLIFPDDVVLDYRWCLWMKRTFLHSETNHSVTQRPWCSVTYTAQYGQCLQVHDLCMGFPHSFTNKSRRKSFRLH